MCRVQKTWLLLVVFALLLSLSKPALAEEVARGKLLGVYPDKHAIIISGAQPGSYVTFKMADNAKVLADNVPIDLFNLFIGEHLVVIYDMEMGTPVASVVRCKRH